MKVAIIGVKYNKETYAKYENIKKIFEKKGLRVDFSYLEDNLESDYEDLNSAYIRNQKIIKGCDFLVAEITQYSSGIGFLVATALNFKKPVLTLFDKQHGEVVSSVIKATADKSKSLTYVEYDTNEALEQVCEEYIQDVKTKLDTKFILIIPAEIDRYLEWTSDSRRMHKAQVVRDAIEKVMETDTEWKEYQATE